MQNDADKDDELLPVGALLSEKAIRHVSGGDRQIVRNGSTLCESTFPGGADLDPD